MPLGTPPSRLLLNTLLVLISLCTDTLSSVRGVVTASVASQITERTDAPFSYRAIVESSSPKATAYLRVASLSIALYDYLSTLPAEYRLYASQASFFRMSNACMLFIAVRYISIVALVTSNVGFFATGFSPQACQNYHLAAPVTNLLAVLVSQIIVSVRTYAISRKSRWVLLTLAAFFLACLVPELVGNVYKRIPLQDSRNNCTSGNIVKVAWLHYLAAVTFDTVATGISSTYLVANAPNLSLMPSLSRLLLKEGMVYFIALTIVNIANLVLFRTRPISTQNNASSMGLAVTMIMSGHIILNLQDWQAAVIYSSQGPASNHELGSVSGGRRRIPPYLRRETISGARGPRSTVVLVKNNDRQVLGTPRTKTFAEDFIRTGRSSIELDPQLQIRVRVEEEVKFDYESDYAPSKGDDGRPSSLPPLDPPDELPTDRVWRAI